MNIFRFYVKLKNVTTTGTYRFSVVILANQATSAGLQAIRRQNNYLKDYIEPTIKTGLAMTLVRLLIITLTLITLTGCAELYEQHMREICSPSGAYSEGANNGRDGDRMRANLGSECARYVPLTWEQQQQINQSYIEGYQFGARNRLINQGINVFGKAITQDGW